jgi:LysR family transcriptional regulator, nitrogen assimilation regulatory protein
MLSAREIIDAKKLQVFYHVTRLGSLSRAEAVLFIAQPAISRSLSRLEEDLGVKLLERHGRGVTPTKFGEILYQQAEIILQEMEETIQKLDRAKRKPSKKVSISASAIVMSLFMPEILNRMLALYPETEVVAVQSPSGEVYNALVSGQVDIAIVMQVPNKKKFYMKKLLEEPMVMIASKNNDVAKLSCVKRDILPVLPVILPASPHGMRRVISDYLVDGNVEIVPHLQIDSVPLIKSMLATENFCVIMPQTSYDKEFDNNEFVGLPLQPPLTRTLYAASHKGVSDEEHVHALLDIISEVFAEFKPGMA